MANRTYITYEIVAPRMQKGLPSTKVPTGWFPELVGVDGRFSGTLRKFYGFKLVKDLSDIETIADVDYCKAVTINKTNTYKLRGFLVRHESTPELTFYYYDTETSSWGKHDLTLDITLSSDTLIDCDAYGDYLYVAIEGNTLQLLYWDDSSITQTDVGAGDYYDGGTALGSLSVNSASTGGYMLASGSFNVAYRYYDSTRKIYSAMSDTITVVPTDEDDTLSGNVAKVEIAIPDPPDDAEALFDKVQIYRTIDQSSVSGSGGILFLEKTIDMATASGGTNQDVGTILDTALTVQDKYDARMDVVTNTPKGGAIQLYRGCLFTGGDPSINGGVDIPFSSPYHESYEYFSSDAKHEGENVDGSPQVFLDVGEAMYAATKNSLIMIRKSGGQIKFQRLHKGRGIVAPTAAHTVGNSLIAVTPMGVGVVDGQQSTMQMLTALDRQISVDWRDNLSNIQSCLDAQYGCSFFLETSSGEMVCVWHNTMATTLLKKTGFTSCTSGIEPVAGNYEQAFFITSTGRIVTPDRNETGSGSMWDMTGTLQGTTTTASSSSKLIDDTASFDSNLVGATVYFPTTSEWATISTVDSGTQLTISGVSNVAKSTKYVLNGVLFSARCWNVPLTNAEGTLKLPFTRRNITSISLDLKELAAFDSIAPNFFRVGAYRNGGDSPVDTDTVDASENPSDTVGDVHVDGIAVEPYIEQMSVGTNFELTMIDVGVTMGDSRHVAASS